MQVSIYWPQSVVPRQIIGGICVLDPESEQNLLTYIMFCPVSDAGVQILVAICSITSDYGHNLQVGSRK